MNTLRPLKVLALIASVTAVCFVSGCATKPAPKKAEYVFFPPAPDEPRVQYLTSFGAESDLGVGNAFADFVVGGQKMHRPIWKPYGIAATKGTLYVCDTQPANVTRIDLNKKKFQYIRPGGQDAMAMPINIAVDKDGTCYVTDTKRGQVLVYKDDQLVAEIGKRSEMKPCGITLAGDRLYVTDLSNRCVRVYATKSREVIMTIPADSKDTHAQLFAPTNVAVDDAGNVYVSDSGGFAVHVFDAKGKHLRMLGEQGLEAGRFALPKGVAVDRAHRAYIVDAATAVVQMFDEQGRLLMYFGEPKSSGPAGLYLPAGISIDYENIDLFQKFAAPGYKVEHLIYVTNQAGPQKVSVYAFVRKG